MLVPSTMTLSTLCASATASMIRSRGIAFGTARAISIPYLAFGRAQRHERRNIVRTMFVCEGRKIQKRLPCDPVTVADMAPAVEAVVDRCRRPVFTGQVRPRDAGAQDVENAIDHTPIIHPLHAARFVRQHRLDEVPLKIAHV